MINLTLWKLIEYVTILTIFDLIFLKNVYADVKALRDIYICNVYLLAR